MKRELLNQKEIICNAAYKEQNTHTHTHTHTHTSYIEMKFRGTEDIMRKTHICLLGVSEGTEEIIEIIKERQHLKRLWEKYSMHSQIKNHNESQTG